MVMQFAPHITREERHSARRLRMIEMLWEAATNGLPCPTNSQFSDELGFKSPSASSALLTRLAESGIIEIHKQRFKGVRVVRLRRAGISTADPLADGMEKALEVAASAFNVPRHAIKGPDRHSNIARARQAFCLVAREIGASSPQIGSYLARDHSTIVHSWRVAAMFEKRDPKFRAAIRNVRAQVLAA